MSMLITRGLKLKEIGFQGFDVQRYQNFYSRRTAAAVLLNARALNSCNTELAADWVKYPE